MLTAESEATRPAAIPFLRCCRFGLGGGKDLTTAAHFIRAILEPVLAGHDSRDIERPTARLRGAPSGDLFTGAALEMALWDLLGKTTRLRVS